MERVSQHIKLDVALLMQTVVVGLLGWQLFTTHSMAVEFRGFQESTKQRLDLLSRKVLDANVCVGVLDNLTKPRFVVLPGGATAIAKTNTFPAPKLKERVAPDVIIP